ncbi:MAG: hypothetical protein AB8G86_04765 [Saprospiraceae bacterium]
MKGNYLIKNKVSEENFEATVYDWLADGDYTPDDIIENIITEHNLMYFPAHFYYSNYKGEVSASLGYMHEESYWTYNPETKRKEKRTRTVTTWQPYSQNVNSYIGVLIYAGESRFDFLRPFIEDTGWGKNDLIKVDDDTDRYQNFKKKYKKNLLDTWNEIGINESHRKATNEIKSNFPSNIISNFKANLNFKIDHNFSVLVPFWVFMYDYKGKKYYVSVDGNNPHKIDGVKPENKARKYTVKAIKWVGWLSTIFLAWTGAGIFYEQSQNSTYRDYRDWIAIGGFILLLAVLGFIVERIIINIKTQSKEKRLEKLAKMRANQLVKSGT